MKKLIILLMIMMIVPVVSAIENLGTFEQNKCVELKQICSNCTFENITSVLYPNSTIALNMVSMTKNGTSYNYTFCSTDAIGTYIVNGLDDLDGFNQVWNYIFEITHQGRELTTGKSIMYVIMLLITCGIFLLTFWGAVVIPFRNVQDRDNRVIGINDAKYLKVILAYMTYFIGLFISGLLYGISMNYLELDLLSNLFYFLYRFLLIGLAIVTPLSVFFLVLMIVQDKKIMKAIERGIQIR